MFRLNHRSIKVTLFSEIHIRIISKISLTYHQIAFQNHLCLKLNSLNFKLFNYKTKRFQCQYLVVIYSFIYSIKYYIQKARLNNNNYVTIE